MLPKKEEIEAVPICHAPRSLKITITWLFIPLCLILLSVLYAYFFKNIFAGELPKSVFVAVVISISIYSVFVYLISYPLVSEKNIQARFIQKYLFILLVIPGIVLAWRFYVRIYEYGLTEQRYYAALIVVWLLFNIAYQVIQNIRHSYDLRIPLLSAAILLLATALSPFSPVLLDYEDHQQASVSDILKNGTIFYNGYGNFTHDKPKVTEIKYSLTFEERVPTDISGYQSSFNVRYEPIANRGFNNPTKEIVYPLANNITVKQIDNCKFDFNHGTEFYKSIELPCREKLAQFISDQKIAVSIVNNQSSIFKFVQQPFVVETQQDNIRIKMVFNTLTATRNLNDPDNIYNILESHAQVFVTAE